MASGADTDKKASADATARNAEMIATLERQFLAKRSFTERVGQAITAYSGRLWMIAIHRIWFTAWIIINTGLTPVPPFDPYPFAFLTFVVSLEAIFLAFFVLMGQNVQSAEADRWARLDLEVNLLAEQEMTKALEMLRGLCEKQGLQELARDATVEELVTKTHIDHVAETLDQKRKDD